jgi:hypothetical protein
MTDNRQNENWKRNGKDKNKKYHSVMNSLNFHEIYFIIILENIIKNDGKNIDFDVMNNL